MPGHAQLWNLNLRWTFLTGTKTIVPLGDVAQGYVGNVLALMSASTWTMNSIRRTSKLTWLITDNRMLIHGERFANVPVSLSVLFSSLLFLFSHVFRGVLFSILAGSNYSSLYSQNEAIFCALFAEVSEAKALMEQIALVCSGRLLLLLRTLRCQTGFTHIGCKVLCTQYVSDILTCWNRLEETGTTVASSFSLPWKHPDMEALLSICAGEHPPLRGAQPSTIGSPSFHPLCLQTTSRPWENYSEPKHTKHELICANVGPFRLSPHDEATSGPGLDLLLLTQWFLRWWPVGEHPVFDQCRSSLSWV